MKLFESKSASEMVTPVPAVRIAPSILSADFTRLGEDILAVETAGANMLHVDVMDGHFVPEITIGPLVVKSVRRATRLPLDVHLMVEDPDRVVEQFAPLGVALLTVHVEAAPHLDRTLARIRSHGIQAGVALNPATPIHTIEHALDLADLVLVMSVNPGFGGQTFIPYALDKIEALRERIERKNLNVAISVDGGVNDETLGPVVRAGASILVAGSAVFHAPDPGKKVKEMLAKANGLRYDS